MATVDLDSIKQRQQVTWASGDFHAVAVTLTLVGELLCESAEVGADEQHGLDLDCISKWSPFLRPEATREAPRAARPESEL